MKIVTLFAYGCLFLGVFSSLMAAEKKERAQLVEELFYFPSPEKQEEIDAILGESPELLVARDERGSTLLHEAV